MNIKKYLSIVVIMAFLVGCGNTTTPDISNVETEKPEPTNNVVSVADYDGLTFLINKTSSLNPLTSNDENLCQTLGLIYQNIVSYTEDDKILLNLIDSYSFDSTTNTFVITVKSDVKWSDGTNISADDFVYSYNILRNASADAYYKNVIRDITYFGKTTDNTIQINVSNKNAGNPYFLAFPILPSHKVDDFVLNDTVHFNALTGNGIYINESVSVNNILYLVDNTYDSIEPNIKNIRLMPTDNNETRYYGFEQGLSNVLASTVSKWSSYHTTKSVNINSYNNMEMVVLGFNYDTKINNDKNFRYCVYNAINFEQVQKSIYLGFCDDSRTLLPKNHFAYNKNIVNEAYDPLKCLEYYNKSTYAGEVLKLITIADSEELKKTSEMIKTNLKTVGVSVEVEQLSLEDYIQRLTSGEYDLYLGTYKMSVLPDYTKLIGSNNYSRYNNEGLVNLVNGLPLADSYQSYQNSMNSIQSIVFYEKAIIPILHNHDAIITDKNVVSVAPESYDSPMQNIDAWTIVIE